MNDIRTPRKKIMIGKKVVDELSGRIVLSVKGKGKQYDTISLQEFIEAFLGPGIKYTFTTDLSSPKSE